MKPCCRGLLLWCAFAFTGCAALPVRPLLAQPAQPPAARTAGFEHAPLVLISIDGYRADYIERGFSPNLAALAASGVHAQALISSFPTLTFPNHYTLVTGLYPDHHGIVNNTMDDPAITPDSHFALSNRAAVGDERWWDEATPLWVSVQRQGGHAATMFWPGSEAPIHGVRPDHWVPFSDKVSQNKRVDTVLGWLDLPIAQRPRFITLYFNAVDTAGHHYGPDSAQVDQALRETDASLGRLIAGLKRRGLYNRMNIVVVSDHGFAAVAPGHNVYLDRIVDLRVLHTVTLASVAGLRPAAHVSAQRVAAAERKLLAPHPHMQCWRSQDIPKRFHYGSNPRIPPLLCLARTGWLITTHYAQAHHTYQMLGEHGYDNLDPLMRALFVAEGPAFRRNLVVPAFPNVDVYPLLAHILGITPENNDGDYAAVEGMLKPAVH